MNKLEISLPEASDKDNKSILLKKKKIELFNFISAFKSILRAYLSDWVSYIVLFAICFKTLLLTGMVMYEENSFIVQLSSFQYLSSPLFYLCFIVSIFSISYLFKNRGHLWFVITLDLFISFIYLIDLWYFRGYSNLLTVQLALHTLNWQSVSARLLPGIGFSDFFYLVDCLALLAIAIFNKRFYRRFPSSVPLFLILFILSVSFIGYKNFDAKKNNKNLFNVLWAPGETIINLSPVGYHVFDIYNYIKECRTIRLDDDKQAAITGWFEKKKEDLPDNNYKGIFKGKNLIYIQVESLENFVINQKVNEKEVTPNINNLLKSSLYFSNYRDQTNHGNSSDADLLINTSVYPLREGGTFMLHPYNTYNSLPKLLEKSGYSTIAVKPDKASGWNWVEALTSIGYQKYIDIKAFKVDEEIGLGLSDGSYLKQLVPMLENQKEPFLNYLVTLSSHSPYYLPDKYRELGFTGYAPNSIEGYLDSVHYTDKQIGIFLTSLKDEGLLNNTVVVIAGDHCGIHKYNDYVGYNSKEHESWWDTNDKRIPLIIYSEGFKGEEFTVNCGQIDTLPTLAYLMGINVEEIAYTSMGRNLLKTDKSFVVLKDGSFIGTFKNDAERNNASDGLTIANYIIKGDFFK